MQASYPTGLSGGNQAHPECDVFGEIGLSDLRWCGQLAHRGIDREAVVLELTVLTVPDCPNEAVLRERLAQALTGHPGASISHHVIDDDAQAAKMGMHGSPTLLINGVDVFAAPGTATSVSCRLYRDQSGPSGGAPSVTALREALRAVAQTAASPSTTLGRSLPT